MLRVLGGEFKGRQLKMARGNATRPITASLRKSLFDSISPYIEGATVVDLFAGTGIIGIEALSRGADHAIFIDLGSLPIRAIRENIALLKLENHASVFQGDAFALFSRIQKKIDIAFVDPPYTIGVEGYKQLLALLAHHKDRFAEGGRIYLEAPTQFAASLLPLIETSFTLHKEKRSSTTTLFHLSLGTSLTNTEMH
jgi:16S rRNA (guanine966-N2)-methyltransferase